MNKMVVKECLLLIGLSAVIMTLIILSLPPRYLINTSLFLLVMLLSIGRIIFEVTE